MTSTEIDHDTRKNGLNGSCLWFYPFTTYSTGLTGRFLPVVVGGLNGTGASLFRLLGGRVGSRTFLFPPPPAPPGGGGPPDDEDEDAIMLVKTLESHLHRDQQIVSPEAS